MRLVDADIMIKHLEDLLCGDCNTPRKEGWCDVCDYAFLINEMKKEPTVDVVAVVKCKDCKYWRDNDCKNDNHGYCPISKDDFCPWGERKDNG